MADKKISQLSPASTPLAGTEVLPIVQGGNTVKVASDDLTVKNVRSNATTGILQIAGPAAASTRIMTVPNANFTAARTDAGQTFTGVNTFTSPKVITSLDDINGNELFQFTATASAVNELTVANAATGNGPAVSATGSDTNISITLTPKGTGNVAISTGNLVVGTSGKGIDFSATPGTGTSELLNDYEEGTWTPTVFGSSTAGAATYTLQVGRYTKIGNTVVCHANLGISAHTGTGNVRLGGLPFTSANVSNIAYAGSIAELGNLTLTALNIATLYLAQNETAIYVIQYPVGGGAASGVAMDSEFNIAFSITYQAA